MSTEQLSPIQDDARQGTADLYQGWHTENPLAASGIPIPDRQPLILGQTTFAEIEQEFEQRLAIGGGEIETPVTTVNSIHNDYSRKIEDNDLQEFIDLDVDVEEFFTHKASADAVEAISGSLAVADETFATAVKTAINAKLSDAIQHIRSRHLDPGITQEERKLLKYAQRDLCFALCGIANALKQDYTVGPDWFEHEISETWTWYKGFIKGVGDMHSSFYEVCNDTFDPDEEDHARQIESFEEPSLDWPDEFHHPAALEIRIDPEKRIEFIYTPKNDVARSRHHSHAEMFSDDGNLVQRDNETLSIRVDVDENAPNGVALDVGRGTRTSKVAGNMQRSPDILGTLFDQASPDSSHEYAGFTAGMASEFKNFAQQLTVQLSLQQQDISRRTKGTLTSAFH